MDSVVYQIHLVQGVIPQLVDSYVVLICTFSGIVVTAVPLLVDVLHV